MRLLLLLSLVLGLAGCQVHEPGKLEKAVAKSVKQNLTVRGKGDRNPFPPTAENIHQGQQNFNNYCIACHGLDGQNTGVPFAEAMSPPAPSLASPEVQAYTDGQLRWIITNGIFPSGMPASKNILNEDEIWQIVVFLRHLPPKGSLGEPAMYNGGSSGK